MVSTNQTQRRRKAQPAPQGLGAEEGIEEPSHHGWTCTSTRVADGQTHQGTLWDLPFPQTHGHFFLWQVRPVFRSHGHGPAAGSDGLHSVLDEDSQDLPDLLRIRDDLRQRGVQGHLEAKSVPVLRGRRHFPADQRIKGHPFQMGGAPARKLQKPLGKTHSLVEGDPGPIEDLLALRVQPELGQFKVP